MKKLWLLGITCLLAQGTICFAEEPVSLEQAIQSSFEYVRERIPDGSRVSIQRAGADSQKVGDYIFEEWVTLAVNDGKLSVADQQIAQGFIVSGSFETLGSSYILRVRLLSVDTEEILAQKRFDIIRSPLLTDLLDETEDSRDSSSSKTVGGLPGGLSGNWLMIGMGCSFVIPAITGKPLIKSYGFAQYQDPNPVGVGFNFLASVQLWDYFALQTDINYQRTSLKDDEFWGSFNDNRLQFALLAKLTLSAWDLLGLEPYAGVYLDVPLGELDYSLGKVRSGEYQVVGSTNYSVQPGFTAGFRMYSWFFFTDYRFGVDFTPTSVDGFNGQSGALYTRTFFNITLGIQWGFIKKNGN